MYLGCGQITPCVFLVCGLLCVLSSHHHPLLPFELSNTFCNAFEFYFYFFILSNANSVLVAIVISSESLSELRKLSVGGSHQLTYVFKLLIGSIVVFMLQFSVYR